MRFGQRIAVSDSLYSVGLGTLELTLYEQAHLFNVLYDNSLIERPAQHASLVMDEIVLNGTTISVAEIDTVKRYHPFADFNNLRPVYLGMHKRLVSNKWDGLAAYDIPITLDSSSVEWDEYDPEAFALDGPVSNYAKSGTTDDVLRPFNVDVTSDKRTNYGLWNATIRIDLSKLSDEQAQSDVRDITIACIGECNTRFTGERDGKTLHKFVSRDLLKKAGTRSAGGFYAAYERYVTVTTPESAKGCRGREAEDVTGPRGRLKKLLDKLPFGRKHRENGVSGDGSRRDF